MKIYIHELESQREGNTYTHFAGGFNYPADKIQTGDYTYGLHVFREAPNLLLRFEELRQIHVLITKDDGNQALLPRAYSTFLWIEITDMKPRDQFTITCFSHQPTLYPSNTLSKFSSPIPSEMHLLNYEVALQQLIFPPQINENTIASIRIGRYNWTIKLHEIRNTVNFIAKVQGLISGSTYRNELVFAIHDGAGAHKGMAFFARRNTALARRRGPLEIIPSINFSKACGQTIKAKEAFRLSAGQVEFFDGIPNIRLAKPHPVAMLNCDILTSNVLSGNRSYLMHCIPVLDGHTHGQKRLYEPPELAFLPVREIPITNIKFEFCNPDLTARDFQSSFPTDSMVITLLFRKKIN
jgi:hypothetical protein